MKKFEVKDVVLQKNVENAMDFEKQSFKENGNVRKLILTIRKRLLQFLGHIMRKRGLENVILCSNSTFIFNVFICLHIYKSFSGHLTKKNISDTFIKWETTDTRNKHSQRT